MMLQNCKNYEDFSCLVKTPVATKCNSCDAKYQIGYTSLHLHHLRVDEHRYSIIGEYLKEKHQQEPTNLQERFNPYEMLRKVLVHIWEDVIN